MSDSLTVAQQVSQVTENFIGLAPMDVLTLVAAVTLSVTCFLRGFSKKFFHFMGWIAAIMGGLYGQNWLGGYLVDFIPNGKIRSFVAIILLTAIIFILSRKLGSLISAAIEGTALSGLDKSLGLLFGLLQAYALVSAVYLGAFVMTEGQLPQFFTQARIRPYALSGAEMMRSLIPEEMRPGRTIPTDVQDVPQLAEDLSTYVPAETE